MKTNILLLLLLVLSFSAGSQDTLFCRNGDMLLANVTEVGQRSLKFQLKGDSTGPIYTLKKRKLGYVFYESGRCEVFGAKYFAENYDVADSSQYLKGIADADENYDTDLGTLALVGSVVFTPLIGWIPAVAITSASPKFKGNFATNRASHTPSYMLGYMEKAHKIKREIVTINYLNWLSSQCYRPLHYSPTKIISNPFQPSPRLLHLTTKRADLWTPQN